MNSKLQKINEKILLVNKIIEQNNNNKLKNIIDEEDKDKDKNINLNNININFYNTHKVNDNDNSFKSKVNIDKNLLLKGKIDMLEDDYNLRILKLESKYNELTSDLNKINEYMNNEYELDNDNYLNLLNDINNIKNNINIEYNESNNQLEQEINYYIYNLNNKIQTIENFYTNEISKDKKNIDELEKFTEEIITEIFNKIKEYNLISDENKKEKSQDICKGLINEEKILENERNNSDIFYVDIKKKVNKKINEMLSNFINIEENKKEMFKNNILEVLAETLNNILVNEQKKIK
jgi:hypothetical protein